MKRKFVFLIFTYLVLASCTNGQVNTRGHQIRFPKYEKFVCLGKEIPSANLKKTSMKIVMYADSTGCTGCKLQLDMWKFYIDDVRKVSNGRVSFLFYLQPRSINELKYLLESEEFDYPVCIDIKGRFAKLNNLNGDYVCLLDKDNRIVLEGHPLQSARIKKKYFDKISQYK